ncbi:6-O-methylguanine DNA methyltransferase [Prosthecochloris marina]|uniref:methylated-DNA--[protein]-cysteine S-methyltransferase n=1 Tax=Prosthecochloris marina TaxID=2017681 RepID=A0A317TB66_9CHLB|nr:6-O-methylguanine DNA methyltransferase [Prosthecochloris marina]
MIIRSSPRTSNGLNKAIQFIEANFKSQPTLDQMAKSVHLSKYHFQRLFKRWAGISPIQFMQFITLDYTKERLIESKNLLETALDAGLSGPSRLHDLFITFDAMTPGDFKKQGSGLQISYGVCDSPLGECLLATTQRGICFFGFVESGERSETLGQLFDTWPGSEFIENPTAVCPIVNDIFKIDRQKSVHPFNLQIKGTNFQINVWRALLNIPMGCIVSYQDVASYIGHPKAFRSVASAIAINPVAYLIPCHRVIAKSGKIHQYRWGAARKKALIGWETARSI